MAIGGIGGLNGLNSLNSISSALSDATKVNGNEDNSVSFSSYLNDALNQVNDLQLQADAAANDLAVGKTDNIHQVMIASEKADIALQFTIQIRNKVMDAYNEIMRMQV
jgi:flagellar hook-basal body complex protein FliE